MHSYLYRCSSSWTLTLGFGHNHLCKIFNQNGYMYLFHLHMFIYQYCWWLSWIPALGFVHNFLLHYGFESKCLLRLLLLYYKIFIIVWLVFSSRNVSIVNEVVCDKLVSRDKSSAPRHMIRDGDDELKELTGHLVLLLCFHFLVPGGGFYVLNH